MAPTGMAVASVALATLWLGEIGSVVALWWGIWLGRLGVIVSAVEVLPLVVDSSDVDRTLAELRRLLRDGSFLD